MRLNNVIFCMILLGLMLTLGSASAVPRHNSSLVGAEYSKIVIKSKVDLPQIDEVGGIIDNVAGDTAWVYIRPDAAKILKARGFVIIKVEQPRGGRNTLDDYHNNDQIQAQFDAWQTQYPTLFSYESIGTSAGGRSLWVCKLSNGIDNDSGKIEVKYIAAIHGDESVGTENCLRFAEELLTTYQTDSALGVLMNNYDIYLLPLMNPDGNAASPQTRGNGHGVDMNRAFPDRIDDSTNSTVGREPEIAAVMNWTAQHNFILSANFHGGAVVTNYPFDGSYSGQSVNTPTTEDALLRYISLRYSQYNTPMYNSTEFAQGITNGCAWYNINGGMQDWNYVWMGDREVTIELSTIKHPAVSTLEGFWQDNRLSMRNYLLEAQYGARGVVTDSVTGQPLRANISLNGSTYLTYSAGAHGEYFRMLRPGTYTLTFSAPGYVTKTFNNVTVTGSTPTMLNVQLLSAPRPDIAVVPAAINSTINPCSQQDLPFAISNTGEVALTWSAAEAYENHTGYGSSTGGGWRFVDSDHAGGPTYSWVDISASGTAVTFAGDDQTLGPFPVGFTFPFYGQNFSTFRLCSNGWISFSSASTAYGNTFLPSSASPENLIAAWWDDLSPQRTGTVIRRWTNNVDSLVVSFANVQSYSGSGVYTFEMILLSSGKIVLQYNSMGTNRLTSATIGLQNSDRTKGTTVVQDAAYIHNSLAVSFCPSSMVALAPSSGTVQPHSSVNVVAHLNSCCVPNGASGGTLAIASNDPTTPVLNVPVTLTVTTVPPDAVADLTVYPVGDNYRLAWSASVNAAGYKVFRMDGFAQDYTTGALLTAVPITNTFFVDSTGGVTATTYYQVVAVQ
ncbi:MAG TPA: M14 family zinc carboxypeptidase [bacterium]|jgi:hypothetical protein